MSTFLRSGNRVLYTDDQSRTFSLIPELNLIPDEKIPYRFFISEKTRIIENDPDPAIDLTVSVKTVTVPAPVGEEWTREDLIAELSTNFFFRNVTVPAANVTGLTEFMDFEENIIDITREPSGFRNPELVIITGNGDRTVTLTGTVECYFKGVAIAELISGYVSPAHGTDTAKRFFLVHNGVEIIWLDLTEEAFDFAFSQICYAFYSGTEWVYLREAHGLMQWQNHREFHQTLGTYLISGGDLSGITLNSTTAAQRRPALNETKLADEDCPSTLPLLPTGSYTQLHLTLTDTPNFTHGAAEIISVTAARPNYNLFTGGAWTQAPFGVNEYGKVFVLAVPVCADAVSQKYRYIFIQPQTTSATLSVIQSLTASSVNLGTLGTALPEFSFVGEIIVRYTAANWVVVSYAKLVGTKVSQVQVTGTAAYRDGFMDYSDLATQSTPIAYTTPNETVIPCDGAGPYTLKTYKPLGITEFWNTVTNAFNFAELSLGDELLIRLDIVVTTASNDSYINSFIEFDQGGTPYRLQLGTRYFKNTGTYNVIEERHVYIGNAGTRTNPAKPYIISSHDCSFKVNGFYISVKRRF